VGFLGVSGSRRHLRRGSRAGPCLEARELAHNHARERGAARRLRAVCNSFVALPSALIVSCAQPVSAYKY
jgi:hypothetical protein